MAITSEFDQNDQQQTNKTNQRVISSQVKTSDAFENSLRPRDLESYIGQSQLKQNLKVFLAAAQKRGECLEHTLLYGPPGLGKTTLAAIIAREMNADFQVTSAPALEKQGDLAAILTNLKPGQVLFIDEIHRLKTTLEETLYSAMEDYVLDIIIGKGPSARTMRLNLPQFTLIGATTKYAMLSNPLRDRFGHVFKLQFYQNSEIESIIDRSAELLNCKITTEALNLLAKCSRRTPRIANRLLKRVRDFAEVTVEHEEKTIEFSIVQTALQSLGIDPLGLDQSDTLILKTLINKFNGGPVGLNTLAAATGEDPATIEDVYEPFLIQLGFLDRSPRGRIATPKAYEHLGLKDLNTGVTINTEKSQNQSLLF